ncbi:tetratricopeptide repeat protein [Paenirhodobacter populi]|uniref:tetratricopeptide repeat protein n=1 Tax=Paenirhodobacter populi TaxID=2306993 RepID=UPI0013E32C40|nr:tetratricopeptide repeat protein [Sinirhodobacter populi]
MRKIILAIIAVLVVGGGVLLATADSKGQKAVKAFASAQAFVEKGDTPRALIELRNALRNDPDMREARLMFADLLFQSGRRADAFGQYRQLYLKNPEDIDAARKLALIAFDGMAWDDAREYGDAVLAKDPDDAEIQAVVAGLDYRDAVNAKDEDAIARAVETEKSLLAQNPGLLQARRLVIADAIRSGDTDRALALTDEGLAGHPDDRDLNNTRLFVLEKLGRMGELEQQLLAMVARYPDDEELGRTLVRFYVKEGRIDDAEKILRATIDPDSDRIEPRMVLMRFLAEVRSPEAMRDELTKILAEDPLPRDVAADPVAFRALKAQADFTLGGRDQGMAELEGLIKGAEPSAEIDGVKVQLARMRQATGNSVGARALVEEVLARDPSQVDAMKLKANWLVEEDKTEAAITLLRDALSDRPNDAQIMMLLSRAYEREGRPELMADMMSRAVDVSNQAPGESLTYARWLFQQGQYASAETILVNALRRQPVNLPLLETLGRTHVAMKDWARAQQDVDAIESRFDTDQARKVAQELRAQVLSGQGRNDELSQLLDQMSRDPDSELAARLAMIRTTVSGGRLDQALSEAQALAADKPDAPAAALLVAQIRLAQGDTAGAMDGVRAILAAHGDFLPGWLALQAMQTRAGAFDDALATVNAGLEKLPDNRSLVLSKAFLLEKKGDIDGAIAIYEAGYAANSDDLLVANNLASLLASTRDDQESLDRAWTVARRLNGTQVPAFLDTYGWISFRRGDTAGALSALEKAAKGLPDDPAVAYHLGRAYAAQGRKEAAAEEYDRADALLSKGAVGYPNLAQDLVRARAQIN